jgi:hypothetical protein
LRRTLGGVFEGTNIKLEGTNKLPAEMSAVEELEKLLSRPMDWECPKQAPSEV